MLSKNPEYRRVKVDGYGALGSASYWLGHDHLLVVATTSYVENYHRFLYSDIQAMLVRRSALRLVWGLVFSMMTVSSLLAAWALKATEPAGNPSREALFGLGALLAVALMFAGLQTLNLLWGPTCVCHLRTAIQTIPLPHLTRWRKAQLLMGELAPLALAAQAQLVVGPAATTVEPTPTPAVGEPGAAPATPEPGPEPGGGTPDQPGPGAQTSSDAPPEVSA